MSRSLLLQHGNEAGTKTTCFHRNDYIEYIKTYQLYLVDCPESKMTAYGQTNLKLDEQKGKEGKKFFKTTWRAQNHVKTQSRRVG